MLQHASSAPTDRAPVGVGSDTAAASAFTPTPTPTAPLVTSPLPPPPSESTKGPPSGSPLASVSSAAKPFDAVRAQSAAIPADLRSPVRRKPLPASASPATRFASADWGRPVVVKDHTTRPQRSFSIDTPSEGRFTSRAPLVLGALPDSIDEDTVPRNHFQYAITRPLTCAGLKFHASTGASLRVVHVH